jgi:hypothetical protein
VQRAGALADEVRRRLEPGAPGDAAARQQADVLLAEVPGGGLGGVARLGVLGEQADEPSRQPLVERGEQDGECRLRDACARRQRLGELAEAVELGELADEGLEYRTVQGGRRNLPVPPPAMLAAVYGPKVPLTVAK